MHILIVSDSYPPEIRSASHLMQELAEEMHDRGHTVTVVTCYPMYNLAEGGPVKQYQENSLEDGIRVIRVRTLPHHKVNFFMRGISQLLLPFLFRMKLKRFLVKRVGAVLVYSPPLPLWRVGLWMQRVYGARFILNIQDIFPQNAIDLGVLRSSLLIRLFERMEKKAYRAADVVTVHSPGNGDFLMEKKGVPAEKLVTLHNWVDVGGYAGEMFQEGTYRRALRLHGKFIFFFGGVIGPSQGLDLLVDAARELRDIEDITILLAGDGTEKERLERSVRSAGLTNVVFHPFVPKEEYRALLKEIDVGLVTLTAKNKTPVVPGKILGYMAAGVPVLALLNRESDGHRIIREADCGYSDVFERADRAAGLMRRMYRERDTLPELGRNGYRYAVGNFSKSACVDTLERCLR